ncbi:hypothetical protein AGLY_001943 [Aphis glycines]|uniref:Uncharacterized protein n=1 Tax=Aphis glycines TaxID=307491 RepID=A0A6G0U5C2_APHGL|nr:hypothetical protein AGLY_001943 [Aphis glycines]
MIIGIELFHSMFFSILTSRATRHTNLLTSLLIKLLRKPILSMCFSTRIPFFKKIISCNENIPAVPIFTFKQYLYLRYKLMALGNNLNLKNLIMELTHHFKEYNKMEKTQKNRVLNSIIVFAHILERELGRKNEPSCLTLPPLLKGKIFHFNTEKYHGFINKDLFSFIIAKIFAQISSTNEPLNYSKLFRTGRQLVPALLSNSFSFNHRFPALHNFRAHCS